MKVVQINNVYGVGSTGKIVQSFHDYLLKHGVDSYVLYARGKNVNAHHVIQIMPEFVVKLQSVINKIDGYLYGGCYINTLVIIRAINHIKPDIVHIQCANASTVNIYKILKFLRERHIPTVITFHAEMFYTGGCSHAFECEKWKEQCDSCTQKSNNNVGWFFDRTFYHWKTLKDIYRSFPELNFTCVSDWVKMRALQSSMIPNNNKINVIYNGVNTNIFHPRSRKETIAIQTKYNIENDYILYLTPNFADPNKGGNYLIQIANSIKEDQTNITIVVVGYSIVAGYELPENVVGIPFTNGQEELAALYTSAKMTIILSKRETFSMVTAESLCCGTPVVGFKAGGPESIALPQASSFVDYGNTKSLLSKIYNILSSTVDRESISFQGINKYSAEKNSQEYINLYEKMLAEKSNIEA